MSQEASLKLETAYATTDNDLVYEFDDNEPALSIVGEYSLQGKSDDLLFAEV